MSLLNEILEAFPGEEILIVDGFDNAIIGIDEQSMRLIYSVRKCIDILTEEMCEEDALEHFHYNVSGAYVGPNTPIWSRDDFELL